MAKQTVWVTGYHAVTAVLKLSPQRASALWLVINRNNKNQAELLNEAQLFGVPIHPVDKRTLAKRCGSEQHQGIALEAKPKQDGNERDLESFVTSLMEKKAPLLLILDQVQDPHNFGACLRTADAAGADAVVVGKDNASPMTPVVQKVASGAAESMPIFRVTNLARSLDTIKHAGIWLVGTSDKVSHSLYDEKLEGPIGLVMGAEGKGMRQLTEKKCDSLVSLPMASSIVSSLNVSVATGVCLYEIGRQRRTS